MRDRYFLPLASLPFVVLLGGLGLFLHNWVKQGEKLYEERRPYIERASRLVAGLDGFPEEVSDADWYIALRRAGIDTRQTYPGQIYSKEVYQKIIDWAEKRDK